MIPAFIPSKDRASQLLLLLESLEKNAPGLFLPHVMYKGSNQKFIDGYEIIKNTQAGKIAVWVEEDRADGERQFYEFLEENAAKDELICLFSDDCIFYRSTNLTEDRIYGMMGDSGIWTFTFRLGMNISIKDYVTGEKCKLPEYIGHCGEYILWNWDKINFWDMFGFVVGFDGYIYRAKDLLELSDKSSYQNRICFWEHMICQKFQQKGSIRKYMAAPLISNVFVQQINTVHAYGHRSNHAFNLSAQELNQRLFDGQKIDINSIDFSRVNCTHGELPFLMKAL
jgi:hypothetical protein